MMKMLQEKWIEPNLTNEGMFMRAFFEDFMIDRFSVGGWIL